MPNNDQYASLVMRLKSHFETFCEKGDNIMQMIIEKYQMTGCAILSPNTTKMNNIEQLAGGLYLVSF